MEEKVYVIKKDEDEERLDKFLALKNNDFSRSYIQKLIDKKRVKVNGKARKSSYRLKEEDRVILEIPEPREPEIKAVEMDLDIIYEDKNIIVLNKPAGLVVHPVPGNWDNTLVNGLLEYTDQLSGINGIKRPGIVHRLDKDTSGALVVAKNNISHQSLIKQFKERKVKKIYHTIIRGNLSYNKGKIDAPIGRNPVQRKKMAVTDRNSKKALTLFKVLERFKDFTYLEIELKTGRTHQIRVHLAYIGHPIIGDKKYSRKKNKLGVKRQLLHAHKIGFFHPVSGQWQEYTAPLPEDFNQFLERLNT